MGNTESTPLASWSTDAVADAVAALGSSPKYEVYAASVRDSGIDGGLLASSLENQEEMDDVLEELQVKSKIHAKVMTRAFVSAMEGGDQPRAKTISPKSSSVSTSNHPPEVIHTTEEDKTEALTLPEDVSMSITADAVEASALAAESYNLTSFSSYKNVEGYDSITSDIMEKNPSAIYAGVHLCLRDGQHTLASKMRIANGSYVNMDRSSMGVTEHYSSCCSKLVRETTHSFVIADAEPDFRAIGQTYVGHVIYNDKGNRLGAVCYLSSTPVEETKKSKLSLEETSSEIAKMAEEQLRLSEQLLSRTKSLQKQVTQARTERFEELKEQHEEKTSVMVPPNKPGKAPRNPNSSLLPWANTNLATEEELEHLPSNFFEAPDSIGMPRVPIGKNDVARVARVETLGLHNMDPDGPLATQLKSILSMASSIFHRPIVTLSIHNHNSEFLVGCCDSNLGVFGSMDVRKRDRQGSVFCAAQGRGGSPCNYTTHKRSTFVVPDLWADDAFNQKKGARFYVGTPIITSDGFPVANLCMLDVNTGYDFTPADQLEFEKIGVLITQNIENWELRRMMDRLVEERKLLETLKNSVAATQSKKKRDAPTGEVTIVLTDIQGSTALWEADAKAMKNALVLHDKVLRKCNSEFNGYEIKTEGDAFHLAFHDPLDAIGFALQAQIELYQAPWSNDILALADAANDADAMFRGPRVRMGIHHGSSVPHVNEVSGRATYSGETFRLSKSIEALCHGGQILASAQTWRMVSELSEELEHPQVVDYGEYVLMTGDFITDGVISKGIVQLVPKRLAFDYFHSSGGEEDMPAPGAKPRGEESSSKGRKFPCPNSKHRLTTSFLDAPSKNGEVTMMFVYPHGTDEYTDQLADETFSVLTKVVRSLLLQVKPPGYECQEDKGKWMIAFESMIPAVNFGLLLMEAINRAPFDDQVDVSTLLRIGVHSGAFSGMCPHPMTGRADYYGPVVNRAARVTAATEAGKVCVGIPVVNPEETPAPPDLGPAISATFVGVRQLKGLTTGMALFCCEDKVRRRVSMLLKDERLAKQLTKTPSKKPSSRSSTKKSRSSTKKSSSSAPPEMAKASTNEPRRKRSFLSSLRGRSGRNRDSS